MSEKERTHLLNRAIDKFQKRSRVGVCGTYREEGSEVGGVGGDHDEAKHPPGGSDEAPREGARGLPATYRRNTASTGVRAWWLTPGLCAYFALAIVQFPVLVSGPWLLHHRP